MKQLDPSVTSVALLLESHFPSLSFAKVSFPILIVWLCLAERGNSVVLYSSSETSPACFSGQQWFSSSLYTVFLFSSDLILMKIEVT